MAQREFDDASATELLKGITIPPQPVVLQAVMMEQQRPEPDMQKIGKVIAKDISLSAAMLRAANSPAFGLRQKVSSIARAVLLLGMRNTASLVTGLILRQAISPKGKMDLEKFWDDAADTALVCSWLTTRFRFMAPDQAHLAGLFHDCGVPLMMQRFPNYKDVLRLEKSSVQEISIAVEEQHFKTNHATIGYIMARTWCLPDEVRSIVLQHHDADVFSQGEDVNLSRRVAILNLAEHLCCLFRKENDSVFWTNQTAAEVLETLAITEEDVIELSKDASDLLSLSVQ